MRLVTTFILAALTACAPETLTSPDASTADAPEVGADAAVEASADVAPVDVATDAAPSCDADTRVDLANCGACGRRCRFDGAEGVCSNGVCTFSRCITGYGDCDGNPANGCEVDTTSSAANCGACGRAVDVQSDPMNCGGCGRMCPTPANAPATCAMGVCGAGACARGYGDCDGNPANGCETTLVSDPMNCGACGRRCSGGAGRCADSNCSG